MSETTLHDGEPIIGLTHSPSFSKIAAAFVAAQKEISGAVKDASNPHFGNKYADLASVDAACRPALNEHGIAIIQSPAPASVNTRLGLSTMLLHESGEWMASVGEIDLGQQRGPQAFGSALTYARRYFLSAMVGVCPEDDDGEGAERGKHEPASKRPPAPKPAAPAQTPAHVSKFLDDIEAGLKEREFPENLIVTVANTIGQMAKSKYKLDSIDALKPEQCAAIIEALKAGKFDAHKTPKQTKAA